MTVRVPSYDGRGLVNLMAEVEERLTGLSPSPGLDEPDLVPEGPTYVLVLFDGLGTAQLEHPAAGAFRDSVTSTIDAPFPTTTSVAKATIATGLPPSRHGLSAHYAWFEDIGQVVNTLKWVTPAGDPVLYDYPNLLPRPNLWERLRTARIEPIVVEPGEFANSPLSQVLFRGARFEGVWSTDELVDATVQLADTPARLIVSYIPNVDFAGHVFGLSSSEFSEAMRIASGVWEQLSARLPDEVVLLGTADHGLAGFTDEQKVLVRDPRYDGLRFAGDSRGLQMWGDRSLMADLAGEVGGHLAEPDGLLGPDPTPAALSRVGELVLVPPDDVVVIPRGFDKRLRCYHGGLSRAEVEIPLLIG